MAILCEKCGKPLSTLGAWGKHRKVCTGSRTRSSHCVRCGKEIKNPGALTNHERKCQAPNINLSANFKQLSPLAARLLILLCMVGTDNVPEILFLRLRQPRVCWGSNGEIQHVALPVVNVLDDSNQFEKNILCLQSKGFIDLKGEILRGRNIIIKPGVRDCMKTIPLYQDRDWKWLCLVLICHTFPGRHEEIGFENVARVLMPQVQHVFACCQNLLEQIDRYPSIGYGITLTLLLSTYISDQQWSSTALGRCGIILDRKPKFGESGMLYLKMLKAQRMRDTGGLPQHASFYEGLPVDQRTNALYGQYHRSNVRDMITRNITARTPSFEEAREELKFEYFCDFPSAMEKREDLFEQSYVLGKIERRESKFEKATMTFYQLYKSEYFRFDEHGCSIIGHLVGTLCENRRTYFAERIARSLIDDFEKCAERGIPMSMKRLNLLLAETLICAALWKRSGISVYGDGPEMLVEAEGILQLLKDELIPGQGELTSRFERKNYLRVCMGRASISHLQGNLTEAYDRWEEARGYAKDCQDVITASALMITAYSQWDISRRLGRLEQSKRLLDKAKRMLRLVGRKYLFACYDTVMLDYYMKSIPDSGKGKCDN